jgi:hypothetical protein
MPLPVPIPPPSIPVDLARANNERMIASRTNFNTASSAKGDKLVLDWDQMDKLQKLTYETSPKANLDMVMIANLTFDPIRTVSFHGMTPDEISESHSTEFEPITIKSRSSPLASYAGSGARTVDLSFDIHEDYLKIYEPKGQYAHIHNFVGRIKALTYPRYSKGIVIPPKCYVMVGEFFRMKAYCNSCNVTWRKPIRHGKYIAANISLSLTEIVYVSFTADEVFDGTDIKRYGDYHDKAVLGTSSNTRDSITKTQLTLPDAQVKYE